MTSYLQHMSRKIAEQAATIAEDISKSQVSQYPVLQKLDHKMHPARKKMVKMYAETLVMNETERRKTIQNWGETSGKRLAKYNLVSMDMMIREVPKYRQAIGEVMKREALTIGLTVEEMYDLISILDQSLNDTIYFFSVPFVTYEKERLQLSQTLVTELSVPIVSIDDDIGILPLMGTVDHDRAAYLQERVLKNASALQLEYLIIDLSGLETTDTFVVQQLYYLFKTLTLLGIQPMASGISPAIAQTMVNLGLTFGDIKSFATLKQALLYISNQ